MINSLTLKKLTLRIVAPSGVMEHPSILPRARKRLKRMGLNVELDEQTSLIHQRFAGTDEQRATALEQALLDPNVNIVMAARGGYGAHRLLPLIDWKTAAAAVTLNNKIIIGHSDFTAIQLALLCHGAASVAGPCAGVDFGGERCNLFMKQSFKEVIMPIDLNGFILDNENTKTIKFKTNTITATGFNTTGIVWGGNLTMLCSLLGTPYFPKLEQIKGGILLIEDVNERPFRVERMLNQLYLAGILNSQSAVLWGDFGSPSILDYDRGYHLSSVIDYARKTLGLGERLITGLPFGHCPKKLSLPIGVQANLSLSTNQQVSLQYCI
jgi:muramoyltetrapeptide carboxypeptidase